MDWLKPLADWRHRAWTWKWRFRMARLEREWAKQPGGRPRLGPYDPLGEAVAAIGREEAPEVAAEFARLLASAPDYEFNANDRAVTRMGGEIRHPAAVRALIDALERSGSGYGWWWHGDDARRGLEAVAQRHPEAIPSMAAELAPLLTGSTGARHKVAHLLRHWNWDSSPTQKAQVAAAAGWFAELAKLGAVAAGPIIGMVTHSYYSEERTKAVDVLQQIITDHPTEISVEVLRAVAQSPGFMIPFQLRELCHQELQRRALGTGGSGN